MCAILINKDTSRGNRRSTFHPVCGCEAMFLKGADGELVGELLGHGGRISLKFGSEPSWSFS